MLSYIKLLLHIELETWTSWSIRAYVAPRPPQNWLSHVRIEFPPSLHNLQSESLVVQDDLRVHVVNYKFYTTNTGYYKYKTLPWTYPK